MSEHKIVPNFELIKALSANVKCWRNVNKAWEETEDEVTIAKVGAIDEDGNKYPVITVDCSDYYADDDSIKVAQYIAAVNPETITNIIEYSESLQSENERLRAQVVALLDQLKDMVSTYRYEASMENETLLETIELIKTIEHDYDAWD